MGDLSDDLLLVTRHKLQIVGRRFADNVRNTLEGKMALIVMLAAPSLMKSILGSASLRAANASRGAAGVILALAHAATVVALILGVAARTARSLIVEYQEEPLALYPGGRRGLAAYDLWGEVAATGLWLLFFFYLFYGALIYGLATQPLLVLPMHLFAHFLVLGALGALAYRLTLRILERRPAMGRSLYIGTSAGAVLAFLAVVGSATLLEDVPPGVMAQLGVWFDGAAVFYPPLAALVQPTNNLLGPLMWVAGVVAAPAVALKAAGPLMREPSPLLLGEVGAPPERRFTSTFRTQWHPKARGMAGIRLFFLKDILLPTTRNPRRFLTRQWTLLALAVTAPVVMWQLRREGRVSEIAAEAALWGVVMALPSVAAYLSGLGSLGREGPELALIRTFLRPATLWGYKVLPVLAAVVPYGLVYGAITGATAAGLALEPGPLQAAGVGGLTGVVAAVNAVALGFLSPDFGRRSVLATGASRTARRLFEIMALYGIGVGVVTRVMTRTEVLPAEVFAVTLVTTAGLGVTMGGIITFLALRRLPFLET